MSRPRKHFSPEEEVSILRRHLLEKEPISKVCEEAGIQPSMFYNWQKQFVENGAAAFQPGPRWKTNAVQERVTFLESKIRRKDEVLAELMEEHVALRKSLGEL
jgi:transposase-like protein